MAPLAPLATPMLRYSNHIFYRTTQGLFMPFLSCHFPSNRKYSVLILDAMG